ncbi:FAD-dependent oxidoreductase [Gordonia sp. HY002]|uniref:oxidoreductase n=1 Tax=Gordonia zhenghanii TaxID=2911516 RepID=UPI001EF13913|nr:FAD-dependent oxidoreductase [Gordonia zhenghanii]MCF8571901.1 FAD-dependent oxidoreductase [Gordonia zhenghanii]MCF8605915.1 FAD-dependent oxidoreductase [Gordonia zhenghanii]
MAETDFPHVFSPFALGELTLRNRLVALPAGTSLVTDGVPDHGDLEHVERLASGGVGLIVGGATVVHPTTTLRSRKLIEAYNDAIVPATAEKVAAAHRHGARYVTQLVHLGREFIGGESDSAPVAPSPIKTVRDAYPPHELTVGEIDDVVEGWRSSAANLVAAGVDGIEVHAAHGYLVAQFMSPLTNRRTDEFGGTFENRMRFTHLVLDAISSEMAAGTVLGVRLSGEEEIPGGMGIDDCVEIARDIADRGDVAYFSVTHGTRGKYVKDSTGPDAVAVPSASRVRAATGVPTLVGQRIRDVATAEHVVKNGHADLVGMARALIADPQLPTKSREGRLREIRGCLGVNQDCRAFDPHLHCAVNAEIGRPRHPNAGSVAERTKTVYVVGGGPAGLEAARVAAERGHRVSLFEAAPELGGSVRIAASAPHRSTLIDIVDYLGNEMRRLGVDVNLAAPIALDDFQEIRHVADHVVVATGSRPADLPSELTGRTVFTVDQAVMGGMSDDAETVVVFDDGDGFWPAYNAAEAVARNGRRVHFATSLSALASRIPAESVGPLVERLRAAGVHCHLGQRLADVDGVLTLESALTGGRLALPDAAVVWHQPRLPQTPFGPLAGSAAGLSVIGDCVSPRRIGHAISEGYRVGIEL